MLNNNSSPNHINDSCASCEKAGADASAPRKYLCLIPSLGLLSRTCLSQPDNETIRQKAKEVISRPDYDLASSDNISAFLKKLWDLFKKLLKPLDDLLDAIHGASPTLFYFIVGFLIVLVLALLGHIGYTIYAAVRRPAGASSYQQGSDASSLLPATWERRAREAAATGEHVLAVRCLLQASLLHLETLRKGTVRRGATNRDYLRQFRSSAIYQPLAVLVHIVDTRWFGGEPCTQNDYEQCSAAHRVIRSNVAGTENAERA